MQPYQRTRIRRDRVARITGVLATLGIHGLALVVLLTSGLTYLDPPPPERSSLVIEFEEETAPKPMVTQVGQEPQAEEIDLKREVDLVQKAESPLVNDAPNVPSEEEEEVLDERALFPGMTKKDSDANALHSASESTPSFKAGQADGNSPEGKTEGSANAHVKGRTVLGTLPKPAYGTQTEGIVVVQVKVDQYGTVTEAVPGAEGTTATDKNLWAAARNAALKAHFNMDANAPAVQTGTITYIFKLK